MPFYFSQLFYNLVDTRNERYCLVATLKGHGSPINAFSFNLNGSLLASGGDDEVVHIWDVYAFHRYQVLAGHAGTWGQITCVKFLNVEQSPMGELLCFGTGRGYLLLYHRQRKTAQFVEVACLQVFNRGDSVETFAFDPHLARIAVSSHYGEIRMLRLQGTGFVELWKDRLEVAAIPRGLTFVDRGECINVFAMESGVVYCRDAETSAVKQTRNLKSSVGNVSVCPATGNFLIDNMINGFDLYSAKHPAPICSFPVRSTKKYIKGGVFAEGGRAVVCGSDHGKVYVFAASDAKPRQELLHGNCGQMIQTVSAYSTPNTHTIATGASDGKYDICIWRKSTKQSVKQSKSRSSEINVLIVINVLFLCIFAWATSDTWFPGIKTGYDSISTRFRADTNSYIKAYHMKIYERQLQRPGLAEVLNDLDDETLRKVLKMPPALTVDDLRIDGGEGEVAVDKEKKAGPRRDGGTHSQYSTDARL